MKDSTEQLSSLADRIIKGDIRAGARLIRKIDDMCPEVTEEIKKLFLNTGKAFILGITGPPGAGKSTLTDQLIESFRKKGKTVAVVAIDPSSSFTGGALLGDRIRMNRHSIDDGVFIRSLGTRGNLGGLTKSTDQIVTVLDAMGWDIILIETVGVGQDEVDIANAAHTTLVVTVPGLGDDIQAIKAGVLEIGDIFVINKADRPDVETVERALATMIELNHPGPGEWWPPVVKTVALKQEGIDALAAEIERHHDYLIAKDNVRLKDRQRLTRSFENLLKEQLYTKVYKHISASQQFDKSVDSIVARVSDPQTEVDKVLSKYLQQP